VALLILDSSIYAHSWSRQRLWANADTDRHTHRKTHTRLFVISYSYVWHNSFLTHPYMHIHAADKDFGQISSGCIRRDWELWKIHKCVTWLIVDSSMDLSIYATYLVHTTHTQDFGHISSGCVRETQRYRDGDGVGIYMSQKFVTSHIWMSDVTVTHFDERCGYLSLPLAIACMNSYIAHMDESRTSHVTHLNARCYYLSLPLSIAFVNMGWLRLVGSSLEL